MISIMTITLFTSTLVTRPSLLSATCATSTQGSVLTSHVINVTNQKTALDCYYHCLGHAFCQSLNYHVSTKLCEINNRTASGRDSYLRAKDDGVYFENPNRVTVGSSASFQAFSCQDVKDGSISPASGVFWVLSNQVYCDMQNTNPSSCPDPFCENGGTCKVLSGGYHCTCAINFQGLRCDKAGDPCLSNPCLNNGTCSATNQNYSCSCQRFFNGTNCENDAAPECRNYQVLSDKERHVTIPTTVDQSDELLPVTWYRFTHEAGNRMPTTCPASNNLCGAVMPGWLNGAEPAMEEGAVTRRACFYFSGDCCNLENTIKIRNCGSYFVYYLEKIPFNGFLRYCGAW
ncbi:delta-like protein 1 [Nematostella vectensis]|uniref:delta-like protein 1 n=1 Tax=Nematostella vectensis TaxID=45351 RepID=UPI00138FF97D|nr:delta-like protein 1 [Nematostella vectensis]XP_048590139.1 delta-like protein 1 [Nematostella vectensis]